jgi:hypothetical protein
VAADDLDAALTLPRRLLAYTRERFPLLPYAIATGLFVASAYATASRLDDRPAAPDVRTVGAAVVVFLLFFQLRVMDERKDERHDARVHPDRPVPRGLIRVAELERIALGGVVLQVAISLWLGVPAFVAYLGTAAFALLMLKEFFAGERLRKNFLVYTLAHLLVLPVLAYYVHVVAAGAALEPAFVLYLALSYALGLLLELSRKFQAPAAERPELHSYTQQLGVLGASNLAIGVVIAASVCASGLGVALGFGGVYHVAVWALCTAVAVAFVRFRLVPSARTASRLGTVHAPAYVLGAYALVVGFSVA